MALTTQGEVLERDATAPREAAFAALVEAQLGPSYRHATLILGDAAEAEEASGLDPARCLVQPHPPEPLP